MLWLAPLLVVALQITHTVAQKQFNPETPCFINLSDSKEACYYSPTEGYECERCSDFENNVCPDVDPQRRNLTMCGDHGQCYTPLALLNEVCYYTHPYGYNCFYEPDPARIGNLTVCVDLKANSAPEIQFVTGSNPGRDTDEDRFELIDIIGISDLDADDSIVEGKGHLTVILTITNGFIAFLPSEATGMAAQMAAEDVLVTNLNNRDLGIEFSDGGNGSYATMLSFTARQTAIQAAMEALVFRPDPDYNTNRDPGRLVLTVSVNDNGNTGGVSETVVATVDLTATPVNDDPTLTIGPQPTVNEDTQRVLDDIVIGDVDQLDMVNGETYTLSLHVSNGDFLITDAHGTTEVHSSHGQRRLTGTMDALNMVLDGDIRYIPDMDTHGDDDLVIIVDDGGHTGTVDPSANGGVVTATVTLTTGSVNDPPYFDTLANPLATTTEDVAVTIEDLSIDDVDTTTPLTVTITDISSGSFSPAGPIVVTDVLARPDVFDSGAQTSPSGPVVYTPQQDTSGTVTISMTVGDGTAVSSKVAGYIVITSVNDPPQMCIRIAQAGVAGVNDPDPCLDTGSWAVVYSTGDTVTWGDFGFPNLRHFEEGTSDIGGFDGVNSAETDILNLRNIFTDHTDSDNSLPVIAFTDVDIGSEEMTVLIVVTGTDATIDWNGGEPAGITTDFQDFDRVVLLFRGTLSAVNNAMGSLTYTSPSPVGFADAEVIVCGSDNAGSGDTSPDGYSVCLDITIENQP